MDIPELKGEVLHIVSPEKAINYKWEENATKLPSGLQIISIDDIDSLPDTIKKRRFGVHNLTENSLLVLEPYSDRYILATDAEQIFLDRKFDALSEITSYLGVSKISLRVESFEETKRQLTVDGKIEYRTVELSAEMKRENTDRYKSRYEKTREYTSPLLTIEGYNKAKMVCEETGLIYDPDFENLLKQRDPNHPNPMKKEVYHIEISKELNKCMDVAFQLNVLKGVFDLSTSVQNSISSSKRIVIETVLEF